MLVLFFVSFGFTYTTQFNQNNNIENLTDIKTDTRVTLIATVDDDVSIRDRSVKTVLRTSCIVGDTSLIPVDVKLLSYFARDSLTETLRYGDRIILRTSLQLPQAEMNPGAFNFRKYLAHQGIFHTAWIGNENVRIMERDCGNPVKAFALRLRNKLLNILENYLGDGDEYAVAAAIVTGYRSALDADLRQAFSNAGAMHVMCVSGLHVGVIFLIISWLLGFLSDKKTLQRIGKVILILLVIWMYALLTGFSASVLRASAMFSFVALGMIVQRKVPIYNSLAASALLLLLINPMFLFQPGFQLSYLAVVGIVALYPQIKKLMPISGKYAMKFRDLVAVSVAAQIATAPVSMYYFHQFPNYFILTNIIVVPLSGLIIYTAIPALVISAVPLLGDALGWMLGLEIKIMNQTVRFIDSLPGALSDGIYLSLFRVIILYAAIFLLFNAFSERRKIQLFVSSALLLVFFAMGSVHQIRQFHHSEFIVPYSEANTMLLVSNGKCLVISSETDENFRIRIEKTMKTYFSQHNIQTVNYISADSVFVSEQILSAYPLVLFSGRNMLVHDNRIYFNKLQFKNEPEFVIVENNPFLDFELLKSRHSQSMFIFAYGNKKSAVSLWEKLAADAGIKYFSVSSSGAFVLKTD